MSADSKVSVKEAAQLLSGADHIYVLCHRAPDGDAIGSAVGMCGALRKLGKRAKVVCADPFAARYAYINIAEDSFPMGFLLCVDTADEKLFGAGMKEYLGKADLCIDHHPSNTFYAKNTLLEPKAGATAEIIYDVIEELKVSFDPFLANCLYTGMATDTGCFRYGNTTSAILRKAANLIDCGAEHGKINKTMFEDKPRKLLEIERQAISTLEFYLNDRCAVMTISREMMEKCDVSDSELEGISSIPRQIEGVVVGITLKQQPTGTYKISVRSSQQIDASKLCSQFGGGGHQRAAGCEIAGDEETVKKLILEAVEKQLRGS